MALTPKKRKLNHNESNGTVSVAKAGIETLPAGLVAATDEEKKQWQGFCEIENEPAFFNVMLREFGVKGVMLKEVWSLDEDSLHNLPHPVYGLIFLFRYRSDDENKQEASCPEHIWFANQTHHNACATVALLNIVNNIPDLDLGENLQRFKDFTQDFTPALRGDAIGSFEFVKHIHNSFARKMDMLNVDLGLRNEFDDRRKPKKKAPDAPKSSKKTKVVTEDDYIDDQAGFHYIAYVPVDDELWKLDGLDRQPEKLGCFEDTDWLSAIVPLLQERMLEYEEGGIEVSLMALCQDELISNRRRLAQSLKSMHAVNARLDEVSPNWRSFTIDNTNGNGPSQDNKILGPDFTSDITVEELEEAQTPTTVAERVNGTCPVQLMELKQRLAEEEKRLRDALQKNEESARDDARRARDRRHDYGPLIHNWLSMLAEREGLLRELVEEAI